MEAEDRHIPARHLKVDGVPDSAVGAPVMQQVVNHDSLIRASIDSDGYLTPVGRKDPANNGRIPRGLNGENGLCRAVRPAGSAVGAGSPVVSGAFRCCSFSGFFIIAEQLCQPAGIVVEEVARERVVFRLLVRDVMDAGPVELNNSGVWV